MHWWILAAIIGSQAVSGYTCGVTTHAFSEDTTRGWWPTVIRRDDEPAIFWTSLVCQSVLVALWFVLP